MKHFNLEFIIRNVDKSSGMDTIFTVEAKYEVYVLLGEKSVIEKRVVVSAEGKSLEEAQDNALARAKKMIEANN